jgi:hypothetical protein
MSHLRLFRMCLAGIVCLVVSGSAGCASALDRSARIIERKTVTRDDAARAAVAADRIAQESIAEAVFNSTIAVAVARQRLAAYRSQRAGKVETINQTRAALTSAARPLAQSAAAIDGNDAAIDAELASFQ